MPRKVFKMKKKCSLGLMMLVVFIPLIVLSMYSMMVLPGNTAPRRLIPRVPGATRRSANSKAYFNDSLQGSSETIDLRKVREDRLYNLNRGCSVLKEKRLVQEDIPPEELGHIIVNDQYKVLFCYVPKVACTNLKRVFLLLTGKMNTTKPLDIKSKDVHFAYDKYLTYLDTFSKEEVEYRVKNYRKYIFVREPLERLLSAYRNKFMEKSEYFHKRYGRRIIRRFREGASKSNNVSGNDVKFFEFVQYITDEATINAEGFNEHWAHYSALCHPCWMKYDFVGKYETLDDDVDFVLKDMHINEVIKFPQRGATYKKKKTKDELLKFYGQIPPKFLKKLWNIYVHDYKLFDYPYPSLLKKLLPPDV